MIVYGHGSKIYQTLFRVHGSALYKGTIPAVFSTTILLILKCFTEEPTHELEYRWFAHPYPIASMVAAFTFLLSFKCSFSYSRYWEACTSLYQMHSKWLDVGIELAAWHLQSKRYDEVRPPAFGAHPELDSVERKREKNNTMTPQKLRVILEQDTDSVNSSGEENNVSFAAVNDTERRRSLWKRLKTRTKQKYTTAAGNAKSGQATPSNKGNKGKSINSQASVRSFSGGAFKNAKKSINSTSATELTPFDRKPLSRLVSLTNLDGGMENEQAPSLFLQEASHLLSLLSAVAFTTLRSDLSKAPAPLCEYETGSPWPSVDPDSVKENYYEMTQSVTVFNYLVGNVRTAEQRTVYNSCRPLAVLGGVSDAEIEMLQRARGPVAKQALCSMWLQEFISREFANGALGKTAPPIISRLFQFVSDGTLGYNQARKVAYIPFPFPHTQLTTFYVVIITLVMPMLMLTFVIDTTVAAIMNFLTIGVFLGLWHVSTELEDPFRNVPNDLPLNNFQAQFNEALVVMFAGFHPEAYWIIGESEETLSEADLMPTSTKKAKFDVPDKPVFPISTLDMDGN